jgi:hypothetical protein
MTEPPPSVPGDDGSPVPVTEDGAKAVALVHMGDAVSTLARWRSQDNNEAVYEVLAELSRDELVALAAALTRELGSLRSDRETAEFGGHS